MSRRFSIQTGTDYPTEIIPGTGASRSGITWTTVDWLEATHLSIGCNGEISNFTCYGSMHPEFAFGDVYYGLPIRLLDTRAGGGFGMGGFGGGGIGGGGEFGGGVPVWFEGTITKIHQKFGGEEEVFEVTAYDNANYLLHRQPVSGQHRRTYTQEAVFFSGGVIPTAALAPIYVQKIDTPTVFNPDGEPNRSTQTYHFNGNNNTTVCLFDKPFRNDVSGSHTLLSDYWTLSQAIRYLFSFYSTGWAIDPASYSDLAMLEFIGIDPVISNVNIQGKTLLQALTILLTPYNYGFWCDPNPSTTTNLHTVHFFYKGLGPAKSLKFSPRGHTSFDGPGTVIDADLVFDLSPVVNSLVGYGNNKVYTTLAHSAPPGGSHCLTLVQGWQSADLTFPGTLTGSTFLNLLDTNFVEHYKNPSLITQLGDHNAYGVGRLWIVNLGQRSGASLEDLTSDLLGDPNSIDNRELERPELYTTSSKGGRLKQEDVIVEMSLDGGDHWAIVERNWYRVLQADTGMGIVFHQQNMETLGLTAQNDVYTSGSTYWQALYEGDLQIRVLCAVKSDRKVSAAVDNTLATAMPLAAGGVYDNPGYNHNLYNSAINAAVYYTKYAPQQANINDTLKLQGLLVKQAANTDRLMVHGTVAVLLNGFGDYFPGDSISQIENRGITFAQKPTVMRVVFDFPAGHVQLALDNQSVANIVGRKPLDDNAANPEQHRLRTGNLQPLKGGHQGRVPHAMETEDETLENLKDGYGLPY